MSYYQDSLFSEEEITGQKNLFSDTANFDSPKASEPVTCLGMTFANDDERRSYFRAELRKKLPELRHIEGFPIGSDDDIINLSDPPYYTACPNPWLNDFIAEWEKEKLQLEADGKRSADFEVTEPYAADVSEGKNNPVYMAHTYHTKCPHPAIMRYILHYTQPGDIVFDGFCGTGMTGVAAAACANSKNDIAQRINDEWKVNFDKLPNWGARHAICGDLSPYAANIASFYNSPVSAELLEKEVKRIYQEMLDECGWMYTTTNLQGKPVGKISFVVWSDVMACPNCGEEFVFWHQAVDMENKCMKDNFNCPHCNALLSKKNTQSVIETYFDDALGEVQKRVKTVPVIVVAKAGSEKIQRKPNEYDLELLNRIESYKITSFYPTYAHPEGYNTEQPKRSREIFHVHQFFTKRNLIALSKLYEKIEASPLSNSLRYLFTGMLILSSQMKRVRVSNPYNRGKGNLSGTLYVPSLPTETSIIDQILERLQTVKSALEILIPSKNLLYVNSADDLTISDNAIDYIFTDPPFGANLNYSELNSLPEPWLKVITNNGHEAIENKAQGKTEHTYRDTMTACFREYFRVLKPGKFMTVEFSNTSAAVWNTIQNALQSSGFVITNVAALDKQQGSFKAVTTTTAVKQDLVITCYKPSDELTEKFKTSEDLAMNVWDFVEELLCHLPVHLQKGNKTTAVVERSPKILFDRVISYYVQPGYPVPMDAADFQHGLRERFVERDGMFFTAEQSLEYDTKRAKTESYEAAQSMFVGSEAEGIEWLKRELVEPKTYQDLQPEWMQVLVQTKKGDNLPELKQILEENFLKDDEGRWYKPDPEKEADLEKVRARELARNFKAYVELASTPKGKIKEARLEALRYGFRECYKEKDFATIVKVAQRLPEALVMEDDVLLQFYDIAINRV